MITTLALIGAGGKMGSRIAAQLKGRSDYQLRCVELNVSRQHTLAAEGHTVVPLAKALPGARVVILAVPDRNLSSIAHEAIPQLDPGVLVITLDPAAAWAGVLPLRPDLSYFVTHPCHTSVFAHETDPAASADFFGGIHAEQPIVCALMQGPESDYARGEHLARLFFGRVSRAHRLTVEQMALLEPAMAETVAASLVLVIREALDEVVRRGVPPEAARDFLFGHLKVPLGIAFDQVNLSFSDGAKLIMQYGRHHLLRPDWKQVFEPEKVKEQVRVIIEGRFEPQP